MQGKHHENVRYVHLVCKPSWLCSNADFEHRYGITASSIIGGFSMSKRRTKAVSPDIVLATVLLGFCLVGVAIMAAYIIHG